MSKLPVVTGAELLRALKRSGFVVARRRGSHVQARRVDQMLAGPVRARKGIVIFPKPRRGDRNYPEWRGILSPFQGFVLMAILFRGLTLTANF